MGVATVYFAPEHNMAAVSFDPKQMRGYMPTDAVNHAYEVLYRAPGNLGPFIYEAWSADEVFLGLVVSERLTMAEGEELNARITLEFQRIIRSNKEAPEMGDFEPKEISI
jgi:hypothetical protein